MNERLKADAEKFSEFMVKAYAPARTWVDPVGYCAWNISHGYMAAVVSEEGKIVALSVARPVDRAGFGVLPFYANEEGSCIHVDLLVDKSDDERAILAFRELLKMRFGRRKTVTMFRGEEEALRVYPYCKFWNHVLRLKKIKMKKKDERHGS